MKVIWMPLAKETLRDTSDYICKEFGKKIRNEFIQEVRHTSRLIGNNPYIGKVEPYLDELPDGFRSIVVSRLNKIVYRILEDRIEISDFWNCRRNPKNLVSNIPNIPCIFIIKNVNPLEQREYKRQACNYHRNHTHKFDKDVERGTRCVFERVAYGVADYRCLVSVGAFAAVVALLDKLLGIVPRAASIVEHYGEGESGGESAYQQTNHARNSEYQACCHGNYNGNY